MTDSTTVILRRLPKNLARVGAEILRSADSAQDDGEWDSAQDDGEWDSAQDDGGIGLRSG